jgi:Protein of unknown function (DUF3108)
MKDNLKFIIVLSFFSFFLVSGVRFDKNINQTDSRFPKKLEVGEELDYVVKYSVMRLGEVKLRITDKKKINGKISYSAVADIDSYPSIPFVKLHQIYETTMTPDYYSKYFKGIIKHSDYTSYSEYHFNYSDSLVDIKQGKIDDQSSTYDTTISVNKKYQDGLSILYYARMNSGHDKEVEIPTFIDKKKVVTDITFEDKSEDVSIDAVDYDIDCVHLEGEAHFISIFGLTGDFEGWFSNDEASIPIKAKMKVLIGNITLELKSWKRTGWNPPKYKD